MYSTVGRPRVLNEASVVAAQEWRRQRKTAKQLAKELGISVGTLINSVKRSQQFKATQVRTKPPALTGASLAVAHEWYRTRRTARERAQELGVTLGQFLKAIERGQSFKTAPPEKRQETLQARRQARKQLESRGLA